MLLGERAPGIAADVVEHQVGRIGTQRPLDLREHVDRVVEEHRHARDRVGGPLPATGLVRHHRVDDDRGRPGRGHCLGERRRNRPADVVAPINQFGGDGKVRVGVAVCADAGHQNARHC